MKLKELKDNIFQANRPLGWVGEEISCLQDTVYTVYHFLEKRWWVV